MNIFPLMSSVFKLIFQLKDDICNNYIKKCVCTMHAPIVLAIYIHKRWFKFYATEHFNTRINLMLGFVSVIILRIYVQTITNTKYHGKYISSDTGNS